MPPLTRPAPPPRLRSVRGWWGAAQGMLRRLHALCLTALLLAGVLNAGRGYLWCSMMAQPVEACCCDPERSDLDTAPDGRAEIKNGCCEHREHAALAQAGALPPAPEVPPALPAAALPASLPAITVASPSPSSFVRSEAPPRVRAGPIRAGPWAASATCARLQVFRC